MTSKTRNVDYYARISGDAYATIGGSTWTLYKAKLRAQKKQINKMANEAETKGDESRAQSFRKLESKLSFSDNICSSDKK